MVTNKEVIDELQKSKHMTIFIFFFMLGVTYLGFFFTVFITWLSVILFLVVGTGIIIGSFIFVFIVTRNSKKGDNMIKRSKMFTRSVLITSRWLVSIGFGGIIAYFGAKLIEHQVTNETFGKWTIISIVIVLIFNLVIEYINDKYKLN